jgi:hypothetical protein
MLVAQLMPPTSVGQKQEVSSAYFACVGTQLRMADGKVIAYQKGHMWYSAAGDLLASIEFTESVLVRFENTEMGRHEDLGPYQRLQLIDGAMWIAGSNPLLIAEFHETVNLWSIRLKPAVAMPKFIATRARVS